MGKQYKKWTDSFLTINTHGVLMDVEDPRFIAALKEFCATLESFGHIQDGAEVVNTTEYSNGSGYSNYYPIDIPDHYTLTVPDSSVG